MLISAIVNNKRNLHIRQVDWKDVANDDFHWGGGWYSGGGRMDGLIYSNAIEIRYICVRNGVRKLLLPNMANQWSHKQLPLPTEDQPHSKICQLLGWSWMGLGIFWGIPISGIIQEFMGFYEFLRILKLKNKKFCMRISIISKSRLEKLC